MNIFNYKLLFILSLLLCEFLYAVDNLSEESLEKLLNEKIELKSQIGSRDRAKNYLDSSSPVDIITAQQIHSSGQTRLTDVLKYYIAGFNVTQTSLTDTKDHIVSYTLRGMSPDQILVLINGKRVHTSAIFVENTYVVASGTTFVDLNTIPLISIQRVEVLRDGAAAQYGSDAIAGIINIILKGQNSTNEITAHAGVTKAGDGQHYQLNSFLSIPLDYDGFFNISLSGDKQYKTERAGVDRRVDPAVVHTHVGLPDSQTLSMVLNSEVVQENNVVLYMNALLNKRDTQASAFYRVADSSRVQYADGFLPMMESTNLDYSLTLGAKGNFVSGWQWDLSNVYGYNGFDYNSKDTMNLDLDPNSPTSFHLGKLIFIQNTTNFDLKKQINNFTVAGGLEYRYENYKIEAGDPASYYKTGSQGYMGYTPQQEVDVSRNNYALYLDTVYKNHKNLSAELALRYENYSDFGSTQDFKLSLGYKPLNKLLLRTTISTGFRAPSLAQSHFSHTSAVLTNNVLTQKGIFTVDHPVSQSLGAKALKPELSKHLTLGGVYQFTNSSSLMIDAFYIHVDDKIIVSDKLKPQTQEQEDVFKAYGVSSASYLTNAIDTKTVGIDIKLNTTYNFRGGSALQSTLWYNYSKNEIINFNQSLSEGRILVIEKGQPKHNVKLLNEYVRGKFNYLVNINGYSKFYQSLGNTAYKFGALVTVDLNVNYKVNKAFDIALGANNIFDTMPDKWDRSNIYLGYDGIIPYSNNSPVNSNGAYYYMNARWKF